MLETDTKAPDFSLNATPDQKVSLSDFAGKKVIMVFYPNDWSPVCGDELAVYNEMLPVFRQHNAELVGISVDSAWCHIAFSHERKLHYPLLADFEPKGDVARRYGVYRQKEGTAERAIFIIDEHGTIKWNHLSPVGINPGADGVLSMLEKLDKK